MTAIVLVSCLGILARLQDIPLAPEGLPGSRMSTASVGVPAAVLFSQGSTDKVDCNARIRRAVPVAMECAAAGLSSSSVLVLCFLLLSQSGGSFDAGVFEEPRKFAIAFTSANIACTGLGTWGFARAGGLKSSLWKTALGTLVGSALGAGLMYASAAHDVQHPSPDCMIFGSLGVLVGGLGLPILGTVVGLNL